MTRKRKVYSNDNLALVGSLQNYLLQHDISAEIRNQYVSGVMGEIGFANAWPELWVSEVDFDQAETLLKEVKNDSLVQGISWHCRHCKEQNPGNFEFCWQCEQPNLKQFE